MSRKVYIKGLNSCSMRRHELEHYRDFLSAGGHEVVDEPGLSDVMLIWTCAFREDVASNSIVQLNRLVESYPGSEVIAVGCFPDIDNRGLRMNFSGKIVPWKEEGKFLENYFSVSEGAYERTRSVFIQEAVCKDAAEYRKQHPDADVMFHDQFCKVLISEGCPYNCAYCTEKRAFPSYRSFEPEVLLEKTGEKIAGDGRKQIVFIGDCIGKYGSDIGLSLPGLMKLFFNEFEGLTIALANLHPADFLEHFDSLKDFIKNDRIVHINLPIQSASDKVLTAMNRGYSRQDLEKIVEMFRELNFTRFDTHIICGFPGETEEDFSETMDFLYKYKPAYVLVSKYYETPGAPSASLLDKVSAPDVVRRLESAERLLTEWGIIYNIEGTDFVKERLRRLNAERRKHAR